MHACMYVCVYASSNKNIRNQNIEKIYSSSEIYKCFGLYDSSRNVIDI